VSDSSLTLIPFAPATLTQVVRATVAALGYRAQILTSGQRMAERLMGVPGTIVFLLDPETGQRAQILTAMDHSRARPSLAILAGQGTRWEPDLVEHCCDCAEWPCSTEELGYRLARLCCAQGSAGRAGEQLDSELCKTLAELNLIGRSPNFLTAMARLRRIAACNAPVLIEGETGTGKELAARAVHYLSARAGGPFVPVNCGALPDQLLENELFGHARGAYTDARSSTLGVVGEAAGGTLFLDEVEALSHKAQVALLRFLQDQEYRPLGGQSARRADTRIIAASNADLSSAAARQQFRPDLFFRLDVLSLRLPPLREHRDDIDHLARHFLALHCRRYGIAPKTLDAPSLQFLRSRSWPGNVRELENLIHREVLLTPGPVLRLRPKMKAGELVYPGTEPSSADTGLPGFAEAKSRAICEFERDYLTRLMAENAGNVTQAARQAGKERRSLGRLLKKHAIDRGV